MTIASTNIPPSYTPASLQHIILAVIAKHPHLVQVIIQDAIYEIPHLREVIINSFPFFQLLPKEIKAEIISFLPLQDWKSLLKMSKEWKPIVAIAAISYINTMGDKLQLIQSFDFAEIVDNVLKQVNDYFDRTRSRPKQVNAVRQLTKEMSLLTQPWAKFIHFQKINQILSAIEEEYFSPHYRIGWFSSPRNSHLYQIIHSTCKEHLDLTHSSWFKKIMTCVKFSPEHPVGKLVADAFSEIENMQKSLITTKAETPRRLALY